MSTKLLWLFNSADINVPGLGPIALSSTIESYTQEVWTTSCDKDGAITPGAECGKAAKEHQMGSYTSPTMTVSPGDNHKNFTVVMDSNTTLILNAWVVPLWVTQEKARLILKAQDVRVKVLGISFSGLTMRNDMTCTGAPGQPSINIPAFVCDPDAPKAQPYATNAYRAICEVGAQDIASTTKTAKPTSKKSMVESTRIADSAPEASIVFA